MTEFEIERKKQELLAKSIGERLRQLREQRQAIPVVESGNSGRYFWTVIPSDTPTDAHATVAVLAANGWSRERP